jgi:uncharacterized protein
MNVPIVVYHRNCADGMAAAWCFWRKYPHWEFWPAAYGDPPLVVENKTVYLVDFSYKREEIQKLLEKNCVIILLDHHKSMFEDLEGFEHPNFNMLHSTMENSGARIAWDYTTESSKRNNVPVILKHIEDRDLWRFQLPYTSEIMAAVFSMMHSWDFNYFDYLMNIDGYEYENLKMQGQAIVRVREQAIKQIIKATSREVIVNTNDKLWMATFVNSPPMYASEIGDIVSKNVDVVAIYYDTKYGRNFSLRSQNGTDIDVSEIAKLYGGGGHKHAAGFSVPRTHYLAMK